MSMLSFRNLTKTYSVRGAPPLTAVRDVNLEVSRGEFVVITGRSGSGKTTLLNLAAGMSRPTAGEVRVGEIDLWQLSDREQALVRNQKIGFVFQFPSLLPSLSVLENVLVPTMFSPEGRRDRAQARAAHLLEMVGLAEKRAVLPRQLSAGQQQRVVIARALINQPEVLLADEPTSNLDERTEQEIMEVLRGIHVSSEITILMVTHTSQLLSYGTRALEMADGRFRDGAE
jgi:ABC-type lipoprotein export system ATPase subunit